MNSRALRTAARLSAGISILLAVAIPDVGADLPPGPYSVMSGRPTPEQLKTRSEQQQILVDGWGMTPAEAARVESTLVASPDNLPSRLRVMSYYTQHLKVEEHARHVIWLIQHHPDADAFEEQSIVTRIGGSAREGNAPAYAAQCLALWREQAGRFPKNPRVLRNAAQALAGVDSPAALEYVKAARAADPANAEWTLWLAKIYADSIRWTFWDGKSMMTFTGGTEDYRHVPFWLRAGAGDAMRNEIASSTDANLVAAVGAAFLREARALEETTSPGKASDRITPDVPQMVEFGKTLVVRALTLQAK